MVERRRKYRKTREKNKQRGKEDEEGGKRGRFSRFSPKKLKVIITHIFTYGLFTSACMNTQVGREKNKFFAWSTEGKDRP